MRKPKSRRKRKRLYFESLIHNWTDNYTTHFRKTFKRYPNRKEL